ncbi:CDP-6-deoxy-delta-3,4-glucoseen reductase, partial [Enterococcus hirae]
ADASVYVSGPPAMVAATKEQALSAGLDPDHLHYDSFDHAHATWPERP